MRDESFTRDPAYERIRRLVEKDLQVEKERRGRFLFRLNIALYIFFLLFVWVRLFPILDGFWDEWWVLSLVVMSLAGFMQLLIHWIVYRLNSSSGERALRDRLLGGALRETIEDKGGDHEKSKRRIEADTDELIDLLNEEWPHETGHNRGEAS